jgi:membrane-bound ClpP family serine protease
MKTVISGQGSAIRDTHQHGPFFLLSMILLFLVCLLGPCTARVAAQSGQVVILHLDDTIQPISAEYLKRGQCWWS